MTNLCRLFGNGLKHPPIPICDPKTDHFLIVYYNTAWPASRSYATPEQAQESARYRPGTIYAARMISDAD